VIKAVYIEQRLKLQTKANKNLEKHRQASKWRALSRSLDSTMDVRIIIGSSKVRCVLVFYFSLMDCFFVDWKSFVVSIVSNMGIAYFNHTISIACFGMCRFTFLNGVHMTSNRSLVCRHSDFDVVTFGVVELAIKTIMANII
jgi:hypothetical protein